MKKQINIGNGDTQESDDGATTQIQIGWNKTLVVSIIAITGYLFLTYVVEPWTIEILCKELIKCD